LNLHQLPTTDYLLPTTYSQFTILYNQLTRWLGSGILLFMKMQVTARAHPNIAFIKFWGLDDEVHRIPANGSLSMNIAPLATTTTVEFVSDLKADALTLNGAQVTGEGLQRVQHFMDRIRHLANESLYARISSENNFPIGVGLASSASGFAALALAGTAALGLELPEREISALARFGSGSASRSIPGGFVEWLTDLHSGESYARSIAPPEHWDLADCIVILSDDHKAVGSEAGMRSARTSPLQGARVQDADRRLDVCRQAILRRDFASLARVTELDSNLMHAVMMTSEPPLYYWYPQSLAVMKAVKAWQGEGLQVTFTLDAGPNVHVITPQAHVGEVTQRLRQLPGVLDVLIGYPGGPAQLVD
jgi:diphosphomevalonate decarboxylase